MNNNMMNGANNMRLMRPHFVDPQTNIVYDTNSADFEGYLTKQSTWLKVCTLFACFVGMRKRSRVIITMQ
jgi:hypothetical protein